MDAIHKRIWRETGNNRNLEREHARAWRKNNPFKIKEYKKRDYKQHKEKYLTYAKNRAITHKKEIKDYMYEYNHKRHLEFKMKVLNHYSNGKMECECCKEKILDFLTIDHLNGDGNSHRKKVGSGHLYKWLIDNNFPEGYGVLCMNCNFGRGLKYNKGVCPHKKNL